MSETNQNDLAALKARADLMGITYHPSIGYEKLRDKIAAKLNDEEDPADEDTPPVAAPVAAPVAEPRKETENEFRLRHKREALALVRIRLTCMNPAKKEWEGEVITAGNSVVGTVSKFVPFNAEEGWHVPRIILEVLKNRQCQVFVSTKSKGGVTQRQGKLIREFAIEELPPLTEEEIKELARRQAMASGASV